MSPSAPTNPSAYPSFAGDDAQPCTYENARVAVLPVPYEGTVSYGGGASKGPRAILEASAQLEMYDEELDRRIAQHEQNPTNVIPWEQIRADLFRKL